MSGDLYRVMGWRSLPTHTKPGWFELAYVCGCTMSKPSYTQVSNNTGDVNMNIILDTHNPMIGLAILKGC